MMRCTAVAVPTAAVAVGVGERRVTGDGRQAAGGDGGGSLSCIQSNFSNIFLTIRKKKQAYLQARGRNTPEPVIVVVAIAVAATAGSVAVTGCRLRAAGCG